MSGNDGNTHESKQLDRLIRGIRKYGASDLHLKIGRSPIFRVDGKMISSQDSLLKAGTVLEMFKGLMSDSKLSELYNLKQTEFSYSDGVSSRVRCTLFSEMGEISAVVKIIPNEIPKPGQLGLPKIVEEFTEKSSGLVLVSGKKGCGKSTTLASLIDVLNWTRRRHILALENPVEFLFTDQKSVITQREIGKDVLNFSAGIEAALNQDSDVIVVSEIRDSQTMQACLMAAERGYLVLAGVNSPTVVEAIERVSDFFPKNEQTAIQAQLALCLQGVVCQKLLPKIGGGRALACEVLNVSENLNHQIFAGRLVELMRDFKMRNPTDFITFDESLIDLEQKQAITSQTAIAHAFEPSHVEKALAELNRSSSAA